MKIWNWFSGKKTVLSTLILSIAVLFNFELSELMQGNIEEVLAFIGSLVAGLGVVHKKVKGEL